MATVAGEAGAYRERTLFARKATGLVRGWAVRDAFIYAFFSINLITLGLFIFTYAVFIPDGSLLWAVVLSGAYLLLQVITYASLIAAMPRAGGDYVWISRILGGGIGFVLAACGWWFILWHWVPIYANILNVEIFVPLGAIVGADGWVSFFSDPTPGLFVSSIIVALMASFVISLGMRTYARIQKTCFYGGLVGLAFMFILLLVHSKADFISALHAQSSEVLGTSANTYEGTLEAGALGTEASTSVGDLGAIKGLFLLIPFILFFNLWSNWGATLYGEVRGASDFRKNIAAMGGALLATTVLAVIMFLLFAKTFGWDFYNASNGAYWDVVYGGEGGPLGGVFPYPGLLASFLMDGAFWQFLLVGLLALWFFGWVGTVFLSSTRVVFATAFDRVLPEAASKVTRNGVPIVAILLMLIPALPISYFYAYDSEFYSWTLAATFVIAVTFAGSAIAAAVLPWRKPEIYNASPIARYRIGPVPLVTATAVGFLVILGFAIYEWSTNAVYGIDWTNFRNSFYYMFALYGLAIGIYVVSRLVRRSQGIDMRMVHSEIPAE